MAQRNKRLRGVFRCDPLSDPPEKIEGTIYNAFPFLDSEELKEGQRAFYFPTICSAYFPPEALDFTYWNAATRRHFGSRFVHESTHRVVSDVVATCRMQYLIYYFLGKMKDFLDYDPGCSILIPSFTVQFSNGETSDVLTKLAEEWDDLFFTVSLIQETVANAVQAESESWGEADPYELLFNDDTRAKFLATLEARGGFLGPVHRETAKDYIWASLKELCTTYEYKKVVDDFFTGPLIDKFLDFYDRRGRPPAFLLARYALNSYPLSSKTALERFQQALQVAERYQEKPGTGFWASFLAFTEYLNQNLPDYNWDLCPLEGHCLANQLELLAKEYPPDKSNVFMLTGSEIMRYLGCGQKANIVIPEYAGDIPISNIALDLLRSQFQIHYWTHDPLDLAIRGLDEASRLEMQHDLLLSLVSVDTNRYKMYLDPGKNVDKVRNTKLYELFDNLDTSIGRTLVFEALWEQLYLGEGPFCFCAPYVPDDCPYRPVLAQLWQQTKPDPKWKPNWKRGDPPFCIRDIIKSETATVVNSLLMSYELDENRQLTDAERTLQAYQWFSRKKFDKAIYFQKGSGNDLLLSGGEITENDRSIFEIAANKVRIAGILYSADDDCLMCCLEDIETGKHVTVPVTEKDENGNEQVVERVLDVHLKRDFVANLQLVVEAPLIKSLFSEEEQELIDLHIRLSSLQSVSSLGRYSWSLQRVLAIAYAEARQLNHNYIGTGHILLALQETEGKARSLLFRMGAYSERVRRTVERFIDWFEDSLQGESLTAQAMKAFELAEEEANGKNLNYIGTEHLLIGLLREGEGVAVRVLAFHGVTLERVRSFIPDNHPEEAIRKLDDDQ